MGETDEVQENQEIRPKVEWCIAVKVQPDKELLAIFEPGTLERSRLISIARKEHIFLLSFSYDPQALFETLCRGSIIEIL